MLAGINVIFFWKILLTDQFSFLIDWDNANQAYPWTQFAAKTLQNGDLPLWDPFAFSGYPFLGEMQTGVFDPLKLPLYLWPVSDSNILAPAALDYQMVFVHLLACCFMFLLAREGGMPPFASLVAGVAFGLGGFVGSLRWPGMLDSAVWLPLIFLFVWKALRAVPWRSRATWASLGGVCLGLAILAGSLHVVIADTLLIAAAAVFFGLTGRGLAVAASRQWPRAAAVGCLTVGISVLVGAVQLLPSFEYAQNSIRWVGAPEPMPSTAEIPYDLLSDEAALPASSVLALLLGGFPIGTAEYSPYQGVLVLLLALFAVFAKRDHPWVVFLALVAGLSFFYSWGAPSLLHGLAYATVPYLDKAREAGRFLYLTHFSLALLAGFGAQALLTGDMIRSGATERFLRALKWTAVLLALAVTTAALVRPDFPSHYFISVVFLAAAYAVLAIAVNGSRSRWLQVAALALIVVDLAAFYMPIKNRREESLAGTNSLAFVLDARPLAEFFRSQDGFFRINVESEEIRNIGDLYGISAIKGGGATTRTNYEAFLANVRTATRLLNVRYTVTTRQIDGREPVFSHLAWRVYEHADYRPRAWIVHDARSAATLDEEFANINEAGLDLQRYAVLNGDVALPPPDDELAHPDRVEIRSYRAGSIDLDVTASQPGVLVVSESFDPGWEARVGDAPASVYRANGALIGLRVPGGPTTVALRYSPRPVWLGASISLTALLAIAVCGVLVWRWDRHSDRNGA